MIKNEDMDILERQQRDDYEWRDGDDTELYDAGYEAGKAYAISLIDIALQRPDEDIERMPTKWLLSILKKSIIGFEEE